MAVPQSTVYTECQAFCPVFRIGSPQPLSPTRKCCSPLWVQGGGEINSLAEEVVGGSQFRGLVINVYYLYNIIALRSVPYPSLRPFANHRTFGLFFFILTACSSIGCCHPYCLLSCNSNCPYRLFSAFSVIFFLLLAILSVLHGIAFSAYLSSLYLHFLVFCLCLYLVLLVFSLSISFL